MQQAIFFEKHTQAYTPELKFKAYNFDILLFEALNTFL